MANQPKIRLHVDVPLAIGAEITVSQPQSHYLMHVMRCNAGDALLVFNGKDGEWLAQISRPDKKHTHLMLQQQLRQQVSSPDIWLAFAPVKNKNEIIIEKAVELGVSRIIPVITRYTIVRNINEERMQARITEAAEQCGRLDIPLLEPAMELDAMLGSWPSARRLLFADERGGRELKSLLNEALPAQKAILIGPEGGFAEEEQQVLHGLSYVTPFSLGPRILRADTAAIAALSCLMAWQGDWQEQPCHPALVAGSGGER